MTLEEFKLKAEEDGEWAPGWEAIDSVFNALYPGQEPAHYATNMVNRALFGGDCYLDGYSIYTSNNGYKHIVTYGMTELYVEEESFGGEWNNWGYEMTIKLAEQNNEDCLWALDVLSNLARYTYTQKRFFEPYQFIAGNKTPLRHDSGSAITALIAVQDTEAQSVGSVYGKTEFIQLVGITEQELDALKTNRENAKKLIDLMKQDNPYLVTDLKRTKSYL